MERASVTNRNCSRCAAIRVTKRYFYLTVSYDSVIYDGVDAPPWTIGELLEQALATIAALPAPKNGQVRAVPDERTVRYYISLGLLDRPLAMRGRTALYGFRHLAQVVAIKRLQTAGRTLADIQAMWPTLDDASLTRMTGLAVEAQQRRDDFWKAPPAAARGSHTTHGAHSPRSQSPNSPPHASPPRSHSPQSPPTPQPSQVDPALLSHTSPPHAASRGPSGGATYVASAPATSAALAPIELRIELVAGASLVIAIPADAAIAPADVRALRAAAAPLVTELARRGLTSEEK